jgi:hypothetical protein
MTATRIGPPASILRMTAGTMPNSDITTGNKIVETINIFARTR